MTAYVSVAPYLKAGDLEDTGWSDRQQRSDGGDEGIPSVCINSGLVPRSTIDWLSFSWTTLIEGRLQFKRIHIVEKLAVTDNYVARM